MLRLLLILLCLSISVSNYSQSSQNETEVTDKEWVLKSFIHDQGKIWTSPFRVKKKDLLIVTPIIGITALSIVYDEEIYSEFKKFQHRHKLVDDVSPIITYMGDDRTSLAVSTIFLGSGFLLKNRKAKQTALMGYQTFVHCGLVIQVMKHLASRQRPSVENGIDKWNGPKAAFKRYTDYYSPYDAFPSGHTIIAWGMATVISKQYKQHKWIPITSYTLATAAGLSRVTEDTHWFSDVIVGGSLGYAIGQFVTRSQQNTHWTLLPSYWNNNAAITAVYGF